jgi:hypothetical protein
MFRAWLTPPNLRPCVLSNVGFLKSQHEALKRLVYLHQIEEMRRQCQAYFERQERLADMRGERTQQQVRGHPRSPQIVPRTRGQLAGGPPLEAVEAVARGRVRIPDGLPRTACPRVMPCTRRPSSPQLLPRPCPTRSPQRGSSRVMPPLCTSTSRASDAARLQWLDGGPCRGCTAQLPLCAAPAAASCWPARA